MSRDASSLLTLTDALPRPRRNPGGIRFGSAEIYDVLDACFAEGTPGLAKEMIIVDALCVGQKIGPEKADERVLLFVKLLEGVSLGPELITAIAKEVRSRRSPRHVPAKVRHCVAFH